MKKLLLFLLLLLAAVAGLLIVRQLAGGSGPSFESVAVTRGSVVRSAVAIGRVEPAVEVPVKSANGGVLTQCFVALGQRVEVGEPLVEVRPVLTDRERLTAERALLAAREGEENVVEYSEGVNLMGRFMLALQGVDNVERMRRGAERSRADAEAQMQLLLEGRAEIDGKVIDFLVRSPVAGNVISIPAEVGEPVVPSSSFGSGTVLLILADMESPVFRGTVDEIDVGRLREGMPATLTLGALPDAVLTGEVTEISLRARRENDAVVFDVELAVEAPKSLQLRSGYSAIAQIELQRADDCLVLPERVVDYRAGGAFVLVDDGGSEPAEVEVETGISDGLIVEITGRLAEGDEVLERVY